MPFTKRMPHYNSAQQLIEYILDEKNHGEKVGIASSINCNIETALMEFNDNNKKYKVNGNRVAYHIIQSFSPEDKITGEQANEIGYKLCKELYPEFQCIISTHIDKGHIHNHICINSTNINGRKLEDRLANEKEGLYGLSDISDKIAAEYGCYIMPRKSYKPTKDKNYYNQYREQTWREKIREIIQELQIKCSSIEELLDELSIQGYEIRRGKYISLKGYGMSKFIRLKSIGNEYIEENLKKFFESKKEIDLDEINFEGNHFNAILLDKTKESKQAISKSQKATNGKIYSEYQKTRYREIQRYYNLKKQLEYLEKYNIHSFDDIEREISIKRSEIKSKNIELKKYKEKVGDIIKTTEMAQDFIKLYKVYEYAMYYKSIDSKYILPKEAEIFLTLKKELNIETIDEAKMIIKNSRTDRININNMKNEILELQRELNHLDTIKEEKLSKTNLYIHNIKFGGNRIDYKKSDDRCFCLNLPYVNEKIYVEKELIAYNEKLQLYTLYLVDDKDYAIYDQDNNKIKTLKGIELEEYVLNKKKEIDKMYSDN